MIEVKRAGSDGLDDARGGAEDGSLGVKRAKARASWAAAVLAADALVQEFVGAAETGAGDGHSTAGSIAGRG